MEFEIDAGRSCRTEWNGSKGGRDLGNANPDNLIMYALS